MKFIKEVFTVIVGCLIAMAVMAYAVDRWSVEDTMRCENALQSVGKTAARAKELCK